MIDLMRWTMMRSVRRGNLEAGSGIIVNLTIIHAGAHGAISTLLPGGKGEITTSSGRSHEIDQWLPRDDTGGMLSLPSFQAPSTRRGEGPLRPPSTKHQVPSTCRGEGPLRPPGTRHHTPGSPLSQRGGTHGAAGRDGGGAPVDRNAGAGAGAATHPVSPMPPGACPSGSHPSQEGIFAWATLLRCCCPVARARSRPLVPRGRL
jgi:hypothetical protein